MPEEIEIETKDLQETIEELQKERTERAADDRAGAWIRYVALTTALLAVFAAIGALKSASLVNEAMMLQLQTSDKWNEYQADRQKEHGYTMQADLLLDQGARLTADPKSEAKAKGGLHPTHEPEWKPMTRDQRLTMFVNQVEKEHEKEKDLMAEATKLDLEGKETMHLHHTFAAAVTLIQVAVALAAVAALAKIRPVWFFSLLVGLAGIGMFIRGFVV